MEIKNVEINVTTLIVRGYGWIIKRTAVHGLILTYMELLFEIAEANGDKIIIVDEMKTDSTHVIIINYERR